MDFHLGDLAQLVADSEDYVDWLTDIYYSVMEGFDQDFPDSQAVMDWAESDAGERFWEAQRDERRD